MMDGLCRRDRTADDAPPRNASSIITGTAVLADGGVSILWVVASSLAGFVVSDCARDGR